MRTPLETVTFDDDVHGPGPKQQSQFSTTFSRERKLAGGQVVTLDIEHDVDHDRVLISLPGAKERPVVIVPWGRVRHAEPYVAPVKEPATAKQTPVAKAAAAKEPTA